MKILCPPCPRSSSCFIIAALFCVSVASTRGDTVWISADEIEASSSEFVFPKAERGVEANGSCVAQLQTYTDGPHEATFSVTVKNAGLHTIWAATTPQRVSWASPFLVLVDGKPIDVASEDTGRSDPLEIKPPAFGLNNNPGLFQWHRFGEIDLSAGQHKVTFKVNERRLSADANGEQAYALFLDTLLVTDEPISPSGPRAKDSATK